MTDEQNTPPTGYAPSKDFDWKWFYFSFNGRLNRQKVWLYYYIPIFIFNLVVSSIFPSLGLVLAILSLWPGLAVGAKRCHDRGKSGWWQLLWIIPIVGFIWWLIDLGILPGTKGENQYGADPLR